MSGQAGREDVLALGRKNLSVYCFKVRNSSATSLGR